MPHTVIAGLLLAATLIWLGMAGRLSAWTRLVVAALLLATLTFDVLEQVGSPLKPLFNTESRSSLFGQQIEVAFWWLLAAKVGVETMRKVFRSRSSAHGARLIPDLIAGALYLAAALTIVGTVLGLPIGALVATSGVIAIVLGLALQSTLSDVFSGIAVSLEQPYMIGDRVILDGQTEGTVVQVNWRSVRVQTDGADLATVPNSLAAKSRIINRSVPTPVRREVLRIPCIASIKPERIIDLARNAFLLCPSILTEPPPSILMSDVGKRFNIYHVAFSVGDGHNVASARSALLIQILRQFRSAHIVGAELQMPGSLEDSLRAIDIPFFQFLTAEQISAFAAGTVKRTLNMDDVLFAEGNQDGSLFIVISGVLEVSRTADAGASIVGRIGPGDYIGEIGLLTGAPHGATVRAIAASVVYELKADVAAPILAAQPEIVHELEMSARQGQLVLDRAIAASVGTDTVASADLLSRIRSYFQAHATAKSSKFSVEGE